jgi:hypothetical protein
VLGGDAGVEGWGWVRVGDVGVLGGVWMGER